MQTRSVTPEHFVTLDAIRAAAGRVRSIARVTPLVDVSAAAGRPLLLKCESLQPGGAFKIRGAYNMVAQLTEEQRRARRHDLLLRQPRAGDGAGRARARRARGRRHADDRAADQGRGRASRSAPR